MDIIAPNAAQRRLLVEMLANELDGDPYLRLQSRARAATLQQLRSLGMVAAIHGRFVLSVHGRRVAERIADQMLGASSSFDDCA